MILRSLAAVLAWAVVAPAWSAETPKPKVSLQKSNDFIRVEINGELFTQYWFTMKNHPAIEKAKDGSYSTNAARHTYFWPILGPGGVRMTRDWPMVPFSEGEDHDHKHHRGLWYAHGSVNGIDFWSEDSKAGRVRHKQFSEVKSGDDAGVIRETCEWAAPDGRVVMTDERTMRFLPGPGTSRYLDFDITFKAPADREVVFGDTKEGSMAIRVNEDLRLTHGKKPGTGKIELSTEVRDQQTWGKRATWCDYSGPLNGKVVGVALFDHPSNPVHPTWWHVRDYGLFAANPFGVHDFEKKPAGTGNLVIGAGRSVTFRYRFMFHEGDAAAAGVAARYSEFAPAP